MPSHVFLCVIAVPLALAVLMCWPAARGLIWRTVTLAPVPALVLGLLGPLVTPFPSATREEWLLLGASFGLDQTARLFLIVTAMLWIAAGAAARQWMRGDARATGFGACFLMAMAGNIGLILAQDAATFYTLFALMSFASYGLVIHTRSERARAAARLYIAFVIAGELALFAGLALAAGEAGSMLLADLRATALSDLAAGLLILGFGVKLGLMPLHFWLPRAHGAAPAPASAVLSGAMIKAGLYGMIVTLPLGTHSLADQGVVVMAAGMVTIFAALLLGVGQDDPKSVLGWSSVSQMGIIALGLGAALLAPAAWAAILPVLVFLAAHHALAKGALFLGVGAFAARGGGPGRRAVFTLLLGPMLVLAGLPMTSGAQGKEALKGALAHGAEAWLPWLVVALSLSGVATTLLLARFAVTLWHRPPSAPGKADADGLFLPFAGLALAALALPALWPVLTAPLVAAKPGDPWPVLAGVAIATGVGLHAHARTIGWPKFLNRLSAPVLRVGMHAGSAVAHRRRALRRWILRLPPTLEERAATLRLGQTAVAGALALVMALLV